MAGGMKVGVPSARMFVCLVSAMMAVAVGMLLIAGNRPLRPCL